MELMQLKASPKRVKLIADTIERGIQLDTYNENAQELEEILLWLRYRLARWNTRTTTDPAA